jgi:hypothetical protein
MNWIPCAAYITVLTDISDISEMKNQAHIVKTGRLYFSLS